MFVMERVSSSRRHGSWPRQTVWREGEEEGGGGAHNVRMCQRKVTL